MFNKLLITITAILFSTMSHAANIRVQDNVIKFDGEIQQGDAINLVMTMQRTGIREVHLNSPGGVAIEGFNIGYGMRELNAKMVVTRSSTCFSACAFAFLGGTEHVLDGLIGFHSAHIPKEFQDQINVGDAFSNGQNIAVMSTQYFYKMGYSLQLQTLITQLTNPTTFLVFKDITELHKFKYTDDNPFGNFPEIETQWIADHIAGPIRLHFLKLSIDNNEPNKNEEGETP